MSVQHEPQSVKAERAYKARQQTLTIIEKIETVLADPALAGRDWHGRMGSFLWWLFWAGARDSGEAFPSFASVRDMMLASRYTGDDHYDESLAPIGSIHWYLFGQIGAAALDMGPMGLISNGGHTDQRFGKGLGFISRAQMAQDYPYLGWSHNVAGSVMLVPDPVVFRGEFTL